MLSEWCAENVKQLHGKNILELGCGVGLTGMSVIAVCHPKQYVFSDYNTAVLDMLCENLRLNFPESNEQHDLPVTCHSDSRLRLQSEFQQSDIRVIELKWEDIEKCTTKDLPSPDIIIGADILYKSDSFDALIQGLKHLLTPNNYAVFAATVRNENTISRFLEQLGTLRSLYTHIICVKIEIFLIEQKLAVRRRSRKTGRFISYFHFQEIMILLSRSMSHRNKLSRYNPLMCL